MGILDSISNWLFENESAISALAGLLAITVILFVPARALWQRLRRGAAGKDTPAVDNSPEPEPDTAHPPDRPSILVLPFDDLSEGGVQGALVDGFTEDLTTLLARMPGFFVFARNTAFTFKDSRNDVQEIGRTLNVRYVLEGSVRPLGDKVRVTAQLIEAAGGTHLWADRFDRPADELHAALDELAHMIALQLGGELTRAEAAMAARDKSAELGAWELYQQAKSLLMVNGWSTQSFQQSAELARKAIAADPEFAPSRAYLALILAMGHWVKLIPDPENAHDEALRCAEEALAQAPNSSEVLGFTGCAFSDLGYSQRGIPIIERAIELDPSNAQAFAALGAAKIVTGDLDAGIDQLEHAIELSPRDAGYAPWSALLSFAFGMRGENDKAMRWARSACQSDARLFLAQLAYGRALAQEGRGEEAGRALAQAKSLHPALDGNYIAEFMGNWVNEQFEQAGVQVG